MRFATTACVVTRRIASRRRGGVWLVGALALLAVMSTSLPAVADDSPGDDQPTSGLVLPGTATDDPPAQSAEATSPPASDEPVSTLQMFPEEEVKPSLPSRAAPKTADEPTADAGQATEPEVTLPGHPLTESPAQPVEPVPEPVASGPTKVEAASFSGITPGVSTTAQVAAKWGPPKDVRKQEDAVIHRYVVEPFKQVEVTFSADRVASIVVRLDKPFPVKPVAEQLGLANLRPVLVSNELGDILGQSYPERGVLFAFKQNRQPGKPSLEVTEIVLEPVGADPFVLRAETNLQSNFKDNLRDLDEAVKLAPNLARAHWLRARILAALGRTNEAIDSSNKAISLEADNPRYRVTHAQILEQAGRRNEAIEQTAKAITMSESRAHIKARAECLMGDLLGDGPKPDWAAALKFHTAAIRSADPLATDRHPAIRLAAKEVLIDAHLGAANDIAWGSWSGKDRAVGEWIKRASAFAEELIANDGGTNEHRFRVASRALAAYAGVGGKTDPADWVRETVRVGNEMIGATADADEKRQLRCEVGMALFNAVQIYQSRKDLDFALECGRQAVGYLEPAAGDPPLADEQRYFLGRLLFRLGAIHAMNFSDHAAAIAWFDKASPLLDKPCSEQPDAEWGRQGESLVSMGVSYWETGRQDRAVQLTREGLAMMKKAVANRAMAPAALGVPYENLALMQRHLGNDKEAEEMDRLAADARATEAARSTGTASKQDKAVRR
jgi:tetratricopeptide (TPR) repeat protein